LTRSFFETAEEGLGHGIGPTVSSSARALFDEALPSELIEDIRGYLQQQKVLGTDRFRSWVEARTDRFSTVRPVGSLYARLW